MDTATNYPRLLNWQSQFAANQSGQLAFLGLVCIIMAYLWWSHNHWPLYTRLTIVAGVFIGALVSGAGALLVGAFLVLGALITYWRAASVRQFPLPRWALLALLALLVRLPGMGESLWYDETFTVSLARLPLDRMFVAIQSDVHPPLWYMVEWLAGRVLGWSEIAVRTPALLFGVLSVLLVYRLAKSIHQNERAAFVAALIAALLPGALYYSNEARGYTLLVCAILGATIGLIENRKWLFAGALILAMYTHNLAFAYAGILCVVALIQRGRSWAWALAGVALAGAVWLPTLLYQAGDITDGFWITPLTPGAVFSPLFNMTVGGRMPETYIALTSATIIALTLWSVRVSQTWIISSRGYVWIALVVGVPFGVAVVSMWHNVYLDRALLPSILMITVAWGYALVEGYRGNAMVARIAIMVALIMAVVPYWSHSNRADLRPLTRVCAGADAVFTTSVSMEMVANYYRPVTTGGHTIPAIWSEANDLNQWLSPSAKEALGWQQTTFERLPHGTVCLLDVDNALARSDERQYVSNILDQFKSTKRVLVDGGTFKLVAYMVQHG